MRVMPCVGGRSEAPEVAGCAGPDSRITISCIRMTKDADVHDTNPSHGNEIPDKMYCADFETAIRMTGGGWFNIFLMFVCGFTYANAAFSLTMVSFVMPAAQCDFHLTSEDKGHLSAAPNIGMLVGHAVWGLSSDASGRKALIFWGVLLDALFSLVSSLAQNYWIFLLSRLICGFGTSATTTLLFAYFGEFLPSSSRDRMLCGLEFAWSVAVTILPGFASLLIPQRWSHSWGFLVLNPWRLFALLCALPNLINALCICVLPEAPRYLMSKGRLDEALAAFRWIHRFNQRGRLGREEYAVMSLQPPESEGQSVNPKNAEAGATGAASPGAVVLSFFASLSSHARTLFTRPLLLTTAMTLLLQTIVMSSYYTLVLWIPDLFERYRRFQALFPNQTASICEVTATVASSEASGVDEHVCDAAVPASVYHDAIYVGVACILAGLALVLLVDPIGKKMLLGLSMVISGTCTISLNFVQTSMQTLILACTFEGLAGISISVLLCLAVELIPTSHRAFALALQHIAGRGGSIVGNILFGFLVDYNCDIPLLTGGVLLIGGGLLCSVIPKASEDQDKK